MEWAYVDNYDNNNKQSSPGDDDGDDPYGFVMLDGTAGSIDSSFASTYEFARRSEEVPKTKRSLFTTNRTAWIPISIMSRKHIISFANCPLAR